MGVNVEIYLMKLNDFLSDSRIIENENLEIEQRLNTNGELIALSFKEKSRIKFINGFELIINNEFGHIDNEIYEVQEYNYHYNAPNDFFRFESKPEPHINDSNDIHWIYNNNSPFHNSSLEVRRTRLQTEQLNLFIVLNSNFALVKVLLHLEISIFSSKKIA